MVAVVLTVTVGLFEISRAIIERAVNKVCSQTQTWEDPAKQNGGRGTKTQNRTEGTIRCTESYKQSYLKLSLSRLPRCLCFGGLKLPCLPDLKDGE